MLANEGYHVDLFEKRSDPLLSVQKSEGRSTNFLVSTRAYEGFKQAGVYQQMLNLVNSYSGFSSNLRIKIHSTSISFQKRVYLTSLFQSKEKRSREFMLKLYRQCQILRFTITQKSETLMCKREYLNCYVKTTKFI